MSSLLYRLGQFSVRRRRFILAAWILGLIAMLLISRAAGGKTTNTFAIPRTQSQQAADLLSKRFPAQSGSSVQVVFAAPTSGTLTTAAVRAELDAAINRLDHLPGVVTPANPAATVTFSPDGTVALANVTYQATAANVPKAAALSLEATARSVAPPGVTVSFGGTVISNAQRAKSDSELIGLAVAVVVLLIAFGSVLAMGLPLLTALIGLGIGLSAIGLLAAVVNLSAAAPILATMIGLAVGIDYALFVITRHRAYLDDGHSVAEAAARAVATAGGAVVFAGLTVVIALAALAVVGIPFLTAMGLAAAATVAVAVAVAVTLLPAMLGFVGHHIDRFRLPGLRPRMGHQSANTWSARWARAITRRPALALTAGLAFMAVLAAPALSMRFGMTDAGSDAPHTTTRIAYDTLAHTFGPGFNGPLTLVVDLTHTDDKAHALAAARNAVGSDPDVVALGQPVLNPTGDTAVFSAIPRSSPAAAATASLVHRLRGHALPAATATSNATAYVAGPTASNIDMSAKLSSALPLFMILVVGLTVLVLTAAFRSILVPVKAALAIFVSIAASFGVLVAVFQWGWLKNVVGIPQTTPIISFLPLMMFAILFGLSMDYEVFILSRIREDYTQHGDAHSAVVTGLGGSARVITAAALIMISVFASFILGDDTIIKMFGLGLATAVFLDATVVRMIIVPAVMALFDRAAWWLPGWLDRVVPNIDLEGERLLAALTARTTPEAEALGGAGHAVYADLVTRTTDETRPAA